MSVIDRVRSSDGGESIAKAIQRHRWLAIIIGLQIVLAVVAVGLEWMAPEELARDSLYLVIPGMIGGWMVFIAAFAIVIFLITTTLDFLENTDDHYLDYLEQ